MRRITTLMVAAVLVVVILATGALPAYAAPQDAGPVGYQTAPGTTAPMYCDNFYNGPPMATTPSGDPLPELHKQQVYWCYSPSQGIWIPTSATYFS
jgi:hypothetical protein